jgi:predicted permease
LFDALRARQSSATDVFAWTRAEGLTLTRETRTYALRAAWASGAAFRVLGISPAMGRLLDDRDDRPGGVNGWAAVISYRHWVDDWRGDPDVIGRHVMVEGAPVTIVGVLPEHFSGILAGEAPQMILPLELEPAIRQADSQRRNPGVLVFTVMGRLRPGSTLGSAAAEVDAIGPPIMEVGLPKEGRDEIFGVLRLDVVSGRSGWSLYRLEYERPLLRVQAFTGIVLVLVSANLAGLLLSRGASRRREFDVRAALGASRSRLLRQLLVEHAALAAVAVPLGCLAAFWLSRMAVGFLGQSGMFASDGGLMLDLRPTLTVVATASLAGLVATILASAAPSLVATRRLATRELQGARSSSRSWGRVLMPLQVGLSLLLVGLAVTAATSIFRLLTTPPGMAAAGVVMASPDLRRRPEQGDDRRALYDRILGELRSRPGIDAAALVRRLPMSGDWSDAHYAAEAGGLVREDRYALQNVVGSGFFRTLGIRLEAGRELVEADRGAAPAVCVLSHSAADYFFPGIAPVGRQIERRASGRQPLLRCEVVGVVADAKYWTLNQEPPRTIYRPHGQEPLGPMSFIVRARSFQLANAALLAALAEMVPEAPVATPVSLEAQMLDSVAVQRALAWLAGSLGALALLLTCISLYGQVAWTVAQRTMEFGIRLALGASRRTIVQMVMGDMARTVALGTAGGCGAVVMVSQFADVFLYKTTLRDPMLVGIAAVSLALACGLAVFFPARRAASVDPAVALRSE